MHPAGRTVFKTSKPCLQKHEGNKKEITVLDPKRSNAINIGMTKLPPPRTIKAAILKMDNSIINREGIEVRGTWLSVVRVIYDMNYCTGAVIVCRL